MKISISKIKKRAFSDSKSGRKHIRELKRQGIHCEQWVHCKDPAFHCDQHGCFSAAARRKKSGGGT